MIDKVLITRKIKLITEDLKELEVIGRKKPEEYLSDKVAEVMTERYLERIIGRMIDINYHIIVELDKPPPTDYFQSFVELGKIKVLPADFARVIANSAGLRNRLVHEYDNMDQAKVYEALKVALGNIPEYLNFISVYLGL